MATPEARNLRFFLGHGDDDNMVPLTFGQLSFQLLSESPGFDKENVELRVYPGLGHWFCPEELEDIGEWLQKVLPQL